MKRKLGLLVALLMGCTAIGGAAKTKIGAPAPEFTLTDTTGKSHSLSAFKGKYVVLEWINHGCPFVKKHYETNNMQALQKEFIGKNVVWLSIASSAEGKEGYLSAADWNKKNAQVKSNATAVLVDAEGTVGKLYGAKTTPHMYIVDPTGVLIYQGAIDDKASTDKADVKGAKNYVREALNEAMAGRPVTAHTTQAYGCSVKYKK